MIVYYAMTKFHLLFCLTHRLLNNKNNDAILIIYSNLSDIDLYYEKILDKGYFSQILILNEIDMRKDWKGVTGPEDEEILNYDIECIVNSIDNWLPFNLADADEIYITNDHWSLGIYCISKKISYYFYEDGVGMLSKPDYAYELVYKLNKTHAYLSKYIGAFANNEMVLKKYADLANQSKGFEDDKAIHYSVTDCLGSLTPNDLNNILDIFGMKQIHINNQNLAALFTEHFVNMKRLTILQQYELYALIIDYFGNGCNLLIKPHPNDIHVNYLDIFPDAKLIDKNFPSELLPYCVDKNIDFGIAACSTAVLGLKKYFCDIIRFDIDIEKKYFKFHRYFSLFHILKILEISHCDLYGIEQDIYNNFKKIYTLPSSFSSKYNAIILDELDENSLLPNIEINQYGCIIFLSFFDNFIDYEELIKLLKDGHWIFLEIEKIKDTKTFLSDDKKEYILVYTRNNKLKQRLKEVHIMSKLEHVGAQININNISDNDKIKIKFLEACLDSTNKKLKYYIEREKELLKLINSND